MNVDLQTTSGFLDGNKLYFWGFNASALFEFSLETGKTRILSAFERVIFSESGMQGGVLKINNDIIITPLLSQYILKYSIISHKHETFSIPLELRSQGYKTNTFYTGEKLCIFPVNSNDKVLEYDYITDEINENAELSALLNRFPDEEYSVSVSGKSLFLLYHNSKKLIELGVDKYEIKREKSIPLKEKIMGLEIIDSRLWILLKESFSLYEIGDELIEYKSTENKWVSNVKTNPYSKIVKYKNELIVLNYYAQDISIIDTNNRKITKMISCLEEGNLINTKSFGGCYRLAIVYDEKLWIFPNMCKYGIKYDGVRCERFMFGEILDEFDVSSDLILGEIKEKEMVFEGRYSLQEYVNCLVKE